MYGHEYMTQNLFKPIVLLIQHAFFEPTVLQHALRAHIRSGALYD